MNEQREREEIRLIKEMAEKTSKAMAGSGMLFIFWRFPISVAILGSYVLAYVHKFQRIWANRVAWADIRWASLLTVESGFAN